MDNKDRKVLQKIYDHVVSVLDYCNNCKDLDEFKKDSMRVEACVFNLMQIGELAKTSISDKAKEEIRTIPWKQLYGMRNRIVHEYSGVDMNIIWDTICEDLPKLKSEIIKYLPFQNGVPVTNRS